MSNCARCGSLPHRWLVRLIGWTDLGAAFCESCTSDWCDSMQGHEQYKACRRADTDFIDALTDAGTLNAHGEEVVNGHNIWAASPERLEIEKAGRPEIEAWLEGKEPPPC